MKRNRLIAVAIAVVMCCSLAFAVAQAGDEHKGAMKEVTIEGLLVDTKCFGMNAENWMADHMTPKGKMPNCAQACASMGIPVAVLEGGEKDGKVYVLITPSAGLVDHMAKTAKVTGMPTFDGALIPSKVMVKNDDGKWEEVKIATMM